MSIGDVGTIGFNIEALTSSNSNLISSAAQAFSSAYETTQEFQLTVTTGITTPDLSYFSDDPPDIYIYNPTTADLTVTGTNRSELIPAGRFAFWTNVNLDTDLSLSLSTGTGTIYIKFFSPSGTGNVSSPEPTLETVLTNGADAGGIYITNIGGMDSTGASPGNNGLTGTGNTSGNGVVGNGAGAAAGILGNGGDSTGPGVVGIGGDGSGTGVQGTGGSPDGAGGSFQGTGSGIGCYGAATGSATGVEGDTVDGVGVVGYASGNGNGVYGQTLGSGAAVVGDSSGGTGYGVIARGDSTTPVKASLRIAPQDTAPSSPFEGDVYANSVDHKLYFYNGTTWNALF